MARRNLSERARRRGRGLAAAGLLAALALAACRGEVPPDHYDTDADLSRDDYREGLAAKPPPRPGPAPPIPEPAPIVDLPDLDIPQGDQRVSLAVNEDVPLKEVLIQLAREVGVDLELDPRIEGGIIFSAQQRPFEEVIARIADLAGLRYRFRDGVLRIEFDTPYYATYQINYPSLTRSASSQISASGSVVSAVGGGDGGGTGTDGGGGAGGAGGSSSANIESQSSTNFWDELRDNIKQIMVNTGRSRALVKSPEEQETELIYKERVKGAGIEESFLEGFADRIQGREPEQQEVEGRTERQTRQAGQVEREVRAPRQPGIEESVEEVRKAFAERVSFNEQAGIISVFGTDRQHRAVREYLGQLHRSVGSQVLIEAKVLNVRLDEEFRYGINWSAIIQGAGFTGTFLSPVAAATQVLSFDTGGEDLTALISLIEDFGTVRALSSPRLTVLQNQTAALKVATEDVFFEIESGDVTVVGETVVDEQQDAEIRTVSVGLVLTVQPFINPDTEEITLTLRPSVTRIVDRVQDPIVPASSVPVIAAQEMDSVVTMHSGEVLVMGGLMEDDVSIDESGVPFFSEVPVLGNLFKSRSQQIEKEELVVLLRATIVEGRGYDAYDAELYNRFGRDRRPFRMEQ